MYSMWWNIKEGKLTTLTSNHCYGDIMQTCTQQTHTHSNTHTQRGTNQIVKKMQYALRRQGGTLSESLSAHFRCGLKECTFNSLHNTAAFNLHLMNFRLKPWDLPAAAMQWGRGIRQRISFWQKKMLQFLRDFVFWVSLEYLKKWEKGSVSGCDTSNQWAGRKTWDPLEIFSHISWRLIERTINSRKK